MYALSYDRRIEKDIRPVPKHLRIGILEKVARLAVEPRGFHVEKLSGVEGYRLRVGDYRVLFTIHDREKRIVVYRILHRREAYR